MTRIGLIVFRRERGFVTMQQRWNPQELSTQERRDIARELAEIAEHLVNDEFEDDGEFVMFPAPEPPSATTPAATDEREAAVFVSK
jgi:hypothetical protein